MLLLLSAMPEEIEALRPALREARELEGAGAARSAWQGQLQGHAVTLAFSRWGKVAAAATAAHLITRVRPGQVIFTGIAGALHAGLEVGDLVVASTAVALGTAHHANGAHVKVRTGSAVAGQSALLTSGALQIGTSSKKALRNNATAVALVGGVMVTKAAAETALVGTVAEGVFNVYALFVSAAGVLSTVMGTAGATLAAVVVPQANATRAMVGMVIVNPTTGDFVGGTTDLDDGTVKPRAVYVNTLGAVAQADQIVGDHKWQVIGLEVSPSTANKQVLLRKI